MAERISREQRMRDAETRDRLASEYVPVAVLPNFTPKPGFRHKWVATHVMGVQVPTNISHNMRDGWTPVVVQDDDDPEMVTLRDKHGHISIGGSMLFEIEEVRVARRDAYYEKQAVQQVETQKSQYLSDTDPRMPKFVESRVDVSKGSR